MFSPSITEVHVFFKWQNSIKTYTSCKKILQEKFRESIFRAFQTRCFALPSNPSSVLHLKSSQAGSGVQRESSGCALSWEGIAGRGKENLLFSPTTPRANTRLA